jgi:hypothetical protein
MVRRRSKQRWRCQEALKRLLIRGKDRISKSCQAENVRLQPASRLLVAADHGSVSEGRLR